MTLLAISSSPRREGNSETLLFSFLNGAARNNSAEVIRLNDLKIRPCQACDKCTDGHCILNDDMQLLYSKVASCSALVVATPIYFGSLSAQLKIFIDRFQSWWHAKYNLKKPFIPLEAGKPAFFLCVGALKKEQYCLNAEQIVKVFLHNLNMKYKGSLCYRGYDEKDSIKNEPSAAEEAYQAGVNFTSYLKN